MKFEVDIDIDKLLSSKENIAKVSKALEECVDPYSAIESFANAMSSEYYSKVMWFQILKDNVLDDYELDELIKEFDEIEDILTPLLEYTTNLKNRISNYDKNK